MIPNSQVSSDSPSRENRSATYTAARLVSDLANPLFIPPLVFAATGWIMRISTEEMIWMMSLSLLFYTLIPMGVTFYLLKTGYIVSLDLPSREKRNRLFIYSIISSSFGSLLLAVVFLAYHYLISVLAIVFLLNPIFGYLLNQLWKISIHAASVASAGTFFLMLWWISMPVGSQMIGILSLFTLLVLLPIMTWARYYLKTHSAIELAGGIVAGLLLTFIELIILLRLI